MVTEVGPDAGDSRRTEGFAATRWTASPLRSSRLNRTAFCGVAPDNSGNCFLRHRGFYECPMAPHVDDTAIALLALSDRRQYPVVQSAVQYLERVAPPPLTAPWSLAWSTLALAAHRRPIACFTILCRDFLISQVQRTLARWHWPASLWTTVAPCQLLEWPFECYSSRFSCWERRSSGWHSGHRSLSSTQISFGSTTEAIPRCGPPYVPVLPMQHVRA